MTTTFPPPPREPLASADEETVRLEADLFRRRRRVGRWQRIRPWVVAVLVLAMVAGGVWLVWFSPYLRAERVQVSGTHVLNRAQVERRAAVPQVPLIRADIDAIGKRVAALAPVKSVEVSRSWPHTVKISIVERTAVAVIAAGTGFDGMDETGLKFRTYTTRPARLPLVTATVGADREARKEAAHVVGSLSADLLARVESVEVTSIDGITLAMRNGKRVVWGSAKESALKAEVLAILVKQPGVSVIDVSVPGRPTTRG